MIGRIGLPRRRASVRCLRRAARARVSARGGHGTHPRSYHSPLRHACAAFDVRLGQKRRGRQRLALLLLRPGAVAMLDRDLGADGNRRDRRRCCCLRRHRRRRKLRKKCRGAAACCDRRCGRPEVRNQAGELLLERGRHHEHAARPHRSDAVCQAPPRPRQQRLDRGQRDAHRGRDLLVREAVEVAKDDRLALSLRELADGRRHRRDLCALSGLFRRLAARRRGDLVEQRRSRRRCEPP